MQIQDVPGTHYARADVGAQATAGNADAWSIFFDPANDVTVTSIHWVPNAAVTGANTNNFALAVQNKGSDGSGSTAVTSTKTYASGTDSVAHDAEALTLSGTAANLDVDAGEVLALVRTVNGTGLASPDGHVVVGYKFR